MEQGGCRKKRGNREAGGFLDALHPFLYENYEGQALAWLRQGKSKQRVKSEHLLKKSEEKSEAEMGQCA